MDSGNYWYAPRGDFESVFRRAHDINSINDEFPSIFFGVTSIKDPTGINNGSHTIEAVRFLTYESFRPFEDSAHGNRPLEYTALKDRLTASMVRSIGRIIPGIADHILFSELGTPLTFNHYVRSTRGACYGTEKILRQLGPFSFRQVSEIKNLYLCGASILHGVSGATTSGLMLAAAIKGCRPSELLRETGQELRIL
jgi:all-trans-retinol 13,14-reductase